MYRIGQGFDIHRLVEGRKLIIGGIDIPHSKGLLGHSDADVLIHSIIDALLGALNLGDIGTHFPDNDEKYKNIDSKILLKETINIVRQHQFEINNIDNTIIAEEPKMKPYIDLMRAKLAEVLETDIDKISIKAKTMEKQDSVGEKKAIITNTVVLLYKKERE